MLRNILRLLKFSFSVLHHMKEEMLCCPHNAPIISLVLNYFSIRQIELPSTWVGTTYHCQSKCLIIVTIEHIVTNIAVSLVLVDVVEEWCVLKVISYKITDYKRLKTKNIRCLKYNLYKLQTPSINNIINHVHFLTLFLWNFVCFLASITNFF